MPGQPPPEAEPPSLRFFADDAVTLANGESAGNWQGAIASQATWAAKDYQLTWAPDGGRMSSAGDMGFTWGHYDGTANRLQWELCRNQRPLLYGVEKAAGWHMEVELDASNTEPPKSGDCCRLP